MGATTAARAITPVRGPVRGQVRLPGSKSYTNRALPIAALAEGTSTISSALFSDDTAYMAGALRALGIDVTEDATSERFVVAGQAGGWPSTQAELFTGNSGTTTRFLTALLATGHGRYTVDGVERMHERPIGDLLGALRSLGVDVRCLQAEGYPPLEIHAAGCPGGSVRMAGGTSSQYFTALLMAAPRMRDGLTLEVAGDLVSKPYLDITIDIMQAFGVRVERSGYQCFSVAPGQQYHALDYTVEPDASNASYFLAAAALTGGRIRVQGLGKGSVQGDVAFLDCLEALGCSTVRDASFLEVQGPAQLHGATLNMADINDTSPTLAALAPFCSSPVEIRGLEHIRHQETDRVTAVTTELRRLGARVDEHRDGWTIWPSTLHAAEIATYDDHRMAMAFSLVGLRVPGVTISDPSCVAKTFPDFFQRFDALTTANT